MKSTKTIRLEPDLQAEITKLAPKGIPEHAVLLFLLELGVARAKGLKPSDLLMAVTNHRIRVTVAASERRQKLIREEAEIAGAEPPP